MILKLIFVSPLLKFEAKNILQAYLRDTAALVPDHCKKAVNKLNHSKQT